MRIEIETPLMKPTSIGFDKNAAIIPKRSLLATIQKIPTAKASAEAWATRSAGTFADVFASVAAITVIVAASGPTASRREGPSNAYPARDRMLE
jgi:hypothetical protein